MSALMLEWFAPSHAAGIVEGDLGGGESVTDALEDALTHLFR